MWDHGNDVCDLSCQAFWKMSIYYNLLSLASKVFSELYVFSSEFNIFEYAQCHVDNISNFTW